MWIGGKEPSKADSDAFEALQGKIPHPDANPFAFAWYHLMVRFSEEVRHSWAGDKKEAQKQDKGASQKQGGKKDAQAENPEQK